MQASESRTGPSLGVPVEVRVAVLAGVGVIVAVLAGVTVEVLRAVLVAVGLAGVGVGVALGVMVAQFPEARHTADETRLQSVGQAPIVGS